MDDLLKKYYSKIAPVLAERGFLRKGRMFGRIVNDVFQGASIEKLRRGQAFRECRIEFGVWPLCEGLTLSRCLDFCDWYYLRQFEVFHDYAVLSVPEKITAENAAAFGAALGRFLSVASGSVKRDNGDCFSWAYEPTPDSIDACVAELYRFVVTYLMPFFERADSCSTALGEIISLEKLFNSNRLAMLQEMCREDGARTLDGVLWNDRRKLLMALRTENFDLAQKVAEIMLSSDTDAYRSAQEHGFSNLEKWRASVEQGEELLARIQQRDKAYFRKTLNEQEVRSREELALFIR